MATVKSLGCAKRGIKMKVCVNIQNRAWKKYKIDFEKIANAAVSGVYKDSEVSITLTDDAHIKKINKKYRGINKPTNVLSFELGDDILLGDIFISLDTVKSEAKRDNISVDEHVAHLVIHGVLHLLGYDHIKEKDAKVMEAKEIATMKKLGYKNPYEETVCCDETGCPGGRTIGGLRKFFMGVWGRILLLAFCGVISSFGFQPFNMWWFTIIGIGGAYILTVKTLPSLSVLRRFLWLMVFGSVYAMSMFWWVLHSIYVVPELTNQFAIWTVPGLLGIGLVGGIFFTIPFLSISSRRANPACRPLLFGAIWTLVLWLREWIFTGFPWNPIANISFGNIFVANSMSLFGALGLTFVIIGLIAAICEILMDKKSSLNWFSLFIIGAFGSFGILYGIKNINITDKYSDMKSPVIRIVQPAQTAEQKATYSHQVALQNAQYNVQKLAALTRTEGDFDFAVYPETTYPFVTLPGDIISLARVVDKPIIIGSNYFYDNKLYNSMLVVKANGTVSNVYSKSHLVPFGEYRPFGNLIPTPGMLTAGNGPELMSLESLGINFVFAPAICYEIIFSDSLLPDGKTPDAIVNITNDNWFGKTPGTYQHLAMVRRYAIESGLPIIRANYSGISAFVSPTGNIIAAIPVGQSGVVDAMVNGAHKTAYREIGRDGWMIIILLFACLATIWLSQISNKHE